jgi:hypothetical protein
MIKATSTLELISHVMPDRVVGVTYVTGLTAELIDHTGVEPIDSAEAISHVA